MALRHRQALASRFDQHGPQVVLGSDEPGGRRRTDGGEQRRQRARTGRRRSGEHAGHLQEPGPPLPFAASWQLAHSSFGAVGIQRRKASRTRRRLAPGPIEGEQRHARDGMDGEGEGGDDPEVASTPAPAGPVQVGCCCGGYSGAEIHRR